MPKVIQVNRAYTHYKKVIHSHGVVDPEACRLKWYDINRSDQPIKQAIRDVARDFVSRTLASSDILSAHELGFVLLHRCGKGFYFLGVCTWRQNNELWKTLFSFEVDTMEDFAIFHQDRTHKDTFCVWELALVCHETQAWTTYLTSNRTDQDADLYLTAVF